MERLLGGSGTLSRRTSADPVPSPGMVVVEVHGAGLNNADVLRLNGQYPVPKGQDASLLGLEFAGTVTATGEGVQQVAPGDRVMGLALGAHATHLLVPEDHCMQVPDAIPDLDAAGFPEVFCTAYDALLTLGSMTTGSRVLIHGGAGGVGTAAVQIASLMGAHPTATTRHPEAESLLRELGAEDVVSDDIAALEGSFDVILELARGSHMADNIRCLAPGGTVVVIGMNETPAPEVNLRLLMQKRGSIRASTMSGRPGYERARVMAEVASRLVPYLATGRIRVPVAAAYPFAAAEEAYAAFRKGGKIGKIILTMDHV